MCSELHAAALKMQLQEIETHTKIPKSTAGFKGMHDPDRAVFDFRHRHSHRRLPAPILKIDFRHRAGSIRCAGS